MQSNGDRLELPTGIGVMGMVSKIPLDINSGQSSNGVVAYADDVYVIE